MLAALFEHIFYNYIEPTLLHPSLCINTFAEQRVHKHLQNILDQQKLKTTKSTPFNFSKSQSFISRITLQLAGTVTTS